MAAVSATAPTPPALVEPDGITVHAEARAADPSGLTAVARLPLLSGSPAALDDDSLVLPAEWGRTVGEQVPVVRADGSRTSLRVAAVVRDGLGDNGLYVTAANAPGARVDRIELRLAPGTDRTAARAAARAAAAR